MDENEVINQKLAILGGPRAVTVEPKENWETPKKRIKEAICKLIDDDIWSEAGTGVSLELETRFAHYIGTDYCLGCDHGTSALWAAHFAVGVGPGDEIIHPAFTWICSISGAVMLGARPVFCEIDPETLVIDPEDVERRITSRTKAITIVHLHGNICDMDAIMDIAERHKLAVIEDCAHCHGAEWDGRKVGSIGDVGCFSLQGVPPTDKPVCAGEGGLMTTNRRDIYERALLFSHLNRIGLAEEFTNTKFKDMAPYNLGLKMRSHPWAMAAALVLMDSLDYRNDRRRAYRQKIYDALKDVRGIHPPKTYPKAKPAGFYGGMYMIYRPEELDNLPVQILLEAMRGEGVNMSHRGYELTHLIKLFADGFDISGKGVGPLTGDYQGYKPGSLPITEDVHNRLLGMPTFIEETPGYSDQVIATLKKVTGQADTLRREVGATTTK